MSSSMSRRRSSQKPVTTAPSQPPGSTGSIFQLPQPYRLLSLQPSAALRRGRNLRPRSLLLLLGLALTAYWAFSGDRGDRVKTVQDAVSATGVRQLRERVQDFLPSRAKTTAARPAAAAAVRREASSALAREIATTLLPDIYGRPLKQWEVERLDDLTGLIECKMTDTCTHKQKHAVLGAVGRWKWSLDDTFARPAGFPNGEAVLGQSWISSIKELGYPFIHIEDHVSGQDVISRISRIYKVLGDNVAAILADVFVEKFCLEATHECIRSPQNPLGVPEWKLFQWDPMYAQAEPVYRQPWSIKSFPIPNHENWTYVGFEIESSCSDIGFIPHSERPRMAYVFGKEIGYFDPQQNEACWKNETYRRLSTELDLRIEAGILTGDSQTPIPDSVVNVGTETRADFIKRLGTARMIIANGRPHESPTPLEGLCAGTPYANIVYGNGWSQHPMLSHESKPYVYNVHVNDEQGLIDAVRESLAHPLDKPFIPQQMSKAAFKDRLTKDLIEYDWESLWHERRAEYGADK